MKKSQFQAPVNSNIDQKTANMREYLDRYCVPMIGKNHNNKDNPQK